MICRLALIRGLVGSIAVQGQEPAPHAAARGPLHPSLPRAIRRDVPMTNAIRRAFDAGTRDATGRPGPNYWQLQTDYTIDARLDPATQTIAGTEAILVHNNSPRELVEIVLRLDHNIYRGLVPPGTSVPAPTSRPAPVLDRWCGPRAGRSPRRP